MATQQWIKLDLDGDKTAAEQRENPREDQIYEVDGGEVKPLAAKIAALDEFYNKGLSSATREPQTDNYEAQVKKYNTEFRPAQLNNLTGIAWLDDKIKDGTISPAHFELVRQATGVDFGKRYYEVEKYNEEQRKEFEATAYARQKDALENERQLATQRKDIANTLDSINTILDYGENAEETGGGLNSLKRLINRGTAGLFSLDNANRQFAEAQRQFVLGVQKLSNNDGRQANQQIEQTNQAIGSKFFDTAQDMASQAIYAADTGMGVLQNKIQTLTSAGGTLTPEQAAKVKEIYGRYLNLRNKYRGQ